MVFKRRKEPGWTAVKRYLPSSAETIVICRKVGDQQWDDAALQYWQGILQGLERVPSSKNTEVYRGRLSAAGPEYYFKRFRIRKSVDLLKQLIAPSRARKSLFHGLQLEQHGFKTPRAVCLIEQRRFVGVRESVLICEALSGSESIRDLLREPALGVAGNRARKRLLLRMLAREAAQLHQQGFYHGDMNAGNVFCRTAESHSFFWLDNERTVKRARLSLRARIHNLKQLNKMRRSVSQTDRMYFWKEYAAVAQLDPPAAKRAAKQIVRKTQRDWERGWVI